MSVEAVERVGAHVGPAGALTYIFMRRGPSTGSMATSRAGASAEHHPDAGLASHRGSLFGGSFGAGAGSSAGARGAASSMQQALEEDNNRLTDDLSQKVSALRYASQTIHDEVSEQNRLLSGMVRGRPRISPRARAAPQRPAAASPPCPFHPTPGPPCLRRALTLRKLAASWAARCSGSMGCCAAGGRGTCATSSPFRSLSFCCFGG